MSISFTNDRDLLRFEWSGSLSDQAIIYNTANNQIADTITPHNVWIDRPPVAIGNAWREIYPGTSYGPSNGFEILYDNTPGDDFGYWGRTIYNRNEPEWPAHSEVSGISKNNNYKGDEEYFRYDMNGDGKIEDLSYLSVSDISITEGESAYLTITRDGVSSPGGDYLSFYIHTEVAVGNGTATEGDDFNLSYSWMSGHVTFALGESSTTILITAIDDSISESDETVTITFRPWANTGLGYDRLSKYAVSSTLTIIDNDSPTYSLGTNSSVNEGESFNTRVTTTNVSQGTTLYLQWSGSTLTQSDLSSGNLQTSGVVGSDGKITFEHTIANDLNTEGNEKVEIKLFSDSAYTQQVGNTATVWIVDTSLGVPGYYSIADVQAYEGDNLSAIVTRTGSTSVKDLTVSTANGTAFAGYDYTTPASTLSFAEGSTSAVLSIATLEDGIVESDETFTINLSSSDSSINFTDSSATATILNDDSAITTTNVVYNTTTISNTTNVTNSTTINNVTWNVYKFGESAKAEYVVNEWFGSSTSSIKQQTDVLESKLLEIETSTWGEDISINRVAQASDSGDYLQAKQSEAATNRAADAKVGSVIDGGKGVDTLRGLGGWDVLDGGDGDDLIHGGNGRDVISGGAGADELHGDFGWNTYKSVKDSSTDLIAIKSDQWLSNWWYGKAYNSPNGEKCDIIEGLDKRDQIKIIGVSTNELTFTNASAHGVSGIGIYAKGTLEALYTGNERSITEIQGMTTGDASASAMNNTKWSYWGNDTVPSLLA